MRDIAQAIARRFIGRIYRDGRGGFLECSKTNGASSEHNECEPLLLRIYTRTYLRIPCGPCFAAISLILGNLSANLSFAAVFRPEFEDTIETNPEPRGYAKCNFERRRVFRTFNCHNRLPANTDTIREFLLCHSSRRAPQGGDMIADVAFLHLRNRGIS